MEKLFTAFSQKFSTQGPSLSIQALEQQVQQTSSEIQEVKTSFQAQIQTVITQNEKMSASMKNLNDTISHQNFVIACIQKEFKDTMSDLYDKLGFAPPNNLVGTVLSSTTDPQPVIVIEQQAGGAPP